MKRIIQKTRSVIVAADVPTITRLQFLANSMRDVDGISAFKLGMTTGLQGLSKAVGTVKSIMGTKFPIIYDHQKAGNDIPDMGKSFAEALKNSGVDAAILFPFAGPDTQEAWMKACFDAELEVIVGGIMTHSKFLVSEGGYIANNAPERIYRLACQRGVRHFVVPGTKIDWVKKIHAILVEELGEGNFVLYAPGFITQGGDVSECGLAAGKEWHAIVGSGIYKKETSEEQREAARAVTQQIAA